MVGQEYPHYDKDCSPRGDKEVEVDIADMTSTSMLKG